MDIEPVLVSRMEPVACLLSRMEPDFTMCIDWRRRNPLKPPSVADEMLPLRAMDGALDMARDSRDAAGATASGPACTVLPPRVGGSGVPGMDLPTMPGVRDATLRRDVARSSRESTAARAVRLWVKEGDSASQ